ncbi:MAG: DUF2007 domain-containing protein [Thioalkalivibrionaceae bacterium]
MKTVYSAVDPVFAALIEQVLRDSGIAAFCFQGGLVGAAGELPPTECVGRVVVVHEEQAEQARAIVRAFLEYEPESEAAWICTECGETLDSSFTQCWSCGRERTLKP